jgi:uncharacterized membrane protein
MAGQPVGRGRANLRRLTLLFVALGVAGLGLRYWHDASRLFWTDEAITALRAAGHTNREVASALVDGRVHAVRDLMRYVDAPNARPLGDVVRSLALDDAQHPPLYYLATGAWMRIFGSSIASLRWPALIFGLLAPFAIAWFAFELYGTRIAAALGFALSGLSPLLVIYSQEAREYGLWATFVALASALFLRAARRNEHGRWIAYAACATAGLYTDVLFATVLVSHAAYALWRLRGTRLAAFAASAAVALLAFAPWAVVMWQGRATVDRANLWTASPWPFSALAAKWAFGAGSAFFDLEYQNGAYAFVLGPILILAACAVVWNVARAPARIRRLTAALLAAPFGLLFLPDLILHAHRSSVTRYGIALWIALLVCTAGFLAHRLRVTRSRPAWVALTFALVAAAGISSAADVQAPVGWDNRQDAAMPQMARVVNAARDPLVVVPERWTRALDLAFYLKPEVRLMLLPSSSSAELEGASGITFILEPDSEAQGFRARSGADRLQRVVAAARLNAQVMRLRGAGSDPDALSLWRFSPPPPRHVRAASPPQASRVRAEHLRLRSRS